MSEDLLKREDVAARHEVLGSKRVPQKMGMQPGNSAALREPLEERLEAVLCEPVALLCEEEAVAVDRLGPEELVVTPESLLRSRPKRNDPFLVAFAEE